MDRGSAREVLSSPSMYSNIELNQGSTEWTSAKSGAFCNLFPLFVALPFVSADYFLYQRLQLFVLCKNIIFNLP